MMSFVYMAASVVLCLPGRLYRKMDCRLFWRMKRGGYREKLLLAIDGSARSMKAAEQVNAILKHGWNRGTSKSPL